MGIVADDLTGAADSAVVFAGCGFSVQLLLPADPAAESSVWSAAEPGLGADSGVLAVATGARALPDEKAASVTSAGVLDLLARGCDRVFVKVDSTMRGSVAGQVRGALAAWSTAFADASVVLCPAFPSQGRTVVDGVVLVGGVSLASSAAASDPVTPVRASRLSELVQGSVAWDLATAPGRVRYKGTPTSQPLLGVAVSPRAGGVCPAPKAGQHGSVLTADAATESDLDALAALIDEAGPAVLAAGSAGLANAFAELWADNTSQPGPAHQAPGRILVAVSSLHPTAAAAVANLTEPDTDVVTTPTERQPSTSGAAQQFGQRVAEQLRQNDYSAIVLVGGDGAAATLKEIGATSVTLHCNLLPGVPLGTVNGGTAAGLRIVTRSGGFGDNAGLAQIVRRLRNPPPREPG
nr:four-carbon acid sugar kinase family protein [Kineosporia babensis]